MRTLNVRVHGTCAQRTAALHHGMHHDPRRFTCAGATMVSYLWFSLATVLAMSLAAVSVMAVRRARRTLQERNDAQRAWDRAYGYCDAQPHSVPSSVYFAEAQRFFLLMQPDFPRGHVRRFLLTWAKRKSLRDLPRAHRGYRLSDTDALACIEEIHEGYIQNGKRKAYYNLDDAVAKRAPHITAAMALYANRQSLLRRLRIVTPLKFYTQHITEELSPELRQQRVECCQFYIGKGRKGLGEYLKRVFFIDEKTAVFHAGSHKCLMMPEDRAIFCNNEEAKQWTKHPRVKFCTMVNYFGGVCGFEVCAEGTTNLESGILTWDKVSLTSAAPWAGRTCCFAQSTEARLQLCMLSLQRPALLSMLHRHGVCLVALPHAPCPLPSQQNLCL